MSNKKIFWIAFFILSCCEFAQVANSKNILANTQVSKTSNTDFYCSAEQTLVSDFVNKGKPVSDSLPR